MFKVNQGAGPLCGVRNVVNFIRGNVCVVTCIPKYQLINVIVKPINMKASDLKSNNL